jgi:hypothetical protein
MDAGSSEAPRLTSPVLHAQAGHATKLALVVGHEREIVRERVGGNPQIVRADGLPRSLQRGPELGLRARRSERHHLQRLEEGRRCAAASSRRALIVSPKTSSPYATMEIAETLARCSSRRTRAGDRRFRAKMQMSLSSR